MFNSQKSGNASLESKDYIKNIGVLFDKHFSWKFHSDTIVSKENLFLKEINGFMLNVTD